MTKKIKFNIDVDNKFIVINKIIRYNFNDIEKLWKIYIKNKYIRIVKSKKMILIIKKLLKVYINL